MISRAAAISASRSAITIVVLLLAWQFYVKFAGTPSYLLPAPDEIIEQFYTQWRVLFQGLAATLTEALAGLFIATIFAFVISIAVVYSKVIRDIVYPIVVAVQAVPKVAIAPLMITWFGFGLESKIVLAGLLCFFPLVVATISGLSNVDQELFDLARSNGATEMKVLLLIRIPRSLPNFMDGLKIALPSAVIGAVVAEFVAGQVGIGVLILQSSAALQLPLTFAGIIILSVATTALFGAVLFVEYFFLRWRRLELGQK